jgi:hypothetical protein
MNTWKRIAVLLEGAPDDPTDADCHRSNKEQMGEAEGVDVRDHRETSNEGCIRTKYPAKDVGA